MGGRETLRSRYIVHSRYAYHAISICVTCTEDASGGGFVLPIYAELIDFVRHLQRDIGHGKTGLRVGVAILDYGMAICSLHNFHLPTDMNCNRTCTGCSIPHPLAPS